MTPTDNPYAPTKPEDEDERFVSRRSRKIAKPDLFTKLCFAFGSLGFPSGVALTATYGFQKQPDEFTERYAQFGIIALGVSVGLLLLAVCQMVAKSRKLNDGQSEWLNPADRA